MQYEPRYSCIRDCHSMPFCRRNKVPVNDYGQSSFSTEKGTDVLCPNCEMFCFVLGSRAHRELLQRILVDGTANILFDRVGRASAQKHIGQDLFLRSIITAAISKLFSPVSDATLLKRFRAETRPGRHYYAAERRMTEQDLQKYILFTNEDTTDLPW